MSTRARSAKSRGKQRAIDPPQPAPIAKTKEVEKRVTRGSTLFSTGGTSTASIPIAEPGPSKQQTQLRPSTILFLSTEDTAPQDYDPPFTLMQREETAQEPAAETIEVPQFRILGENELLTRVRKTKGDTMDTSDAAYARRHRGPEILEKRAKKQEIENLSQESNKLRALLDRVKLGENVVNNLWTLLRSNVQMRPITLPEGCSADEERQAKAAELDRVKRLLMREAEDTLRRYEDLLNPRQPSTGPIPTITSTTAPASIPDRLKRKDSPRLSVEPPLLPTSFRLKFTKDAQTGIYSNASDSKLSSRASSVQADKPPRKRQKLTVTVASRAARPRRSATLKQSVVDAEDSEGNLSSSLSPVTSPEKPSRTPDQSTATLRRSPRKSSPRLPIQQEEEGESEAEIERALISGLRSDPPHPQSNKSISAEVKKQSSSPRRRSARHILAFGVPLPERLELERDFELDSELRKR